MLRRYRFQILTALVGAVIGAIVGPAIFEFVPDSAARGAIIGAFIGVLLALRLEARRAASRNPEAAARKKRHREGQRLALRNFSPGNDMGDSIKVGSIHGKMDRFKDGSSPYQ